MHTITESHGHRVLTVADDVALGGEDEAVDLIGLAFGEQADVVAVPAELVDERFYELRTRVAGDVVRKFAAYQIRLVVLGDLTGRLAASDSLRAFVYEANRGRDIWFLADRTELDERLRTARETLGRSR
ncbi:DUF4180 domain-containing protein [Actinophytocola xanthii]|uniref:DUF4180 domain-containing protein n=1 Tax=Actinophytocola xanthii TaxID=1912961 RepID=A0A1Q8CSY4_9PSEU|nr:DUF4180 domain-containing protein [Actinophytocola xanthii]OLF17456.1 hypothetical protein BU204_10940 [Actinophytocola xanthii]